MVRSKAALLALFLLVGCPGPSGKVDPYITARAVISGAQMSLTLADGIFMQWAVTQTDPAKVKAATEKFNYIKLCVADGLRIANDAVNVAEAAKAPVDITKIMDQAEIAWKDLRVFLTDLLGKPKPPASAPAKAVKAEKKFDVSILPESLLPKK